MDVCDRDGDKIGTVHQVFAQAVTRTMPAGTAAKAPGLPSASSVFQIDTGLLGLTHYYMPFSAVGDIPSNCIFVDADKDGLKTTGWDRRPEWVHG
jgi:hypothetical protein